MSDRPSLSNDGWLPTPLPEGPGPHALSLQGRELVVIRDEQGIRCFDGVCPHQGALLGEGELQDGVLVCRNHRWRFDEQGARIGGPQCLRRYKVRQEVETLWVRLDEEEQQAVARPPGLRGYEDLAGPRMIPFLGNALAISTQTLHADFENWAKEYGPLYRFRLGRDRFIGVAKPELIEAALRARPDRYTRAVNLQPLFKEMGVHGIFSAEGEEWRSQRKLVMRALAPRNLKDFYPTLLQVAERLLRRWRRAADEGRILDLQAELMLFTVDVTTTLAFGRDINTIENEDNRLQQHLEHIFPALGRRLTAVFPYWRYVRLPRDRALDRSIQAVRKWVSEVIEESRAALAAKSELATNPRNFLEAMLSARDENGKPFGEDVLFGNAMNILLGGEDTTANTLAWSVHHLCDEPEVVAELQAELDKALGSDELPPDYRAASRLDYAVAVANEAMRFRSVAPMLILAAKEDHALGELWVEKGVMLALLTRFSGRTEEHVDSAKRFDPQRWLKKESISALQRQAVHIPFGSGPRICPGRALALLEMEVILALLYRYFHVTRVGKSTDVAEEFSFAMEPKGLRVKLSHRHQNATENASA
jgi:cytochrome P450/nitrite reductase/ring-hydroxylating ferredoxin subunit